MGRKKDTDKVMDALLRRSGGEIRKSLDDALDGSLESHREQVLLRTLAERTEKRKCWIPRVVLPKLELQSIRWATVCAVLIVGLYLIPHGGGKTRFLEAEKDFADAPQLVWTVDDFADDDYDAALGEDVVVVTYTEFLEDFGAALEEESSGFIDYGEAPGYFPTYSPHAVDDYEIEGEYDELNDLV